MSLIDLEKEGWNIDERALNKALEEAETTGIINDTRKLREFVLDCDLREIASPGLANAFNSTKKELNGPIVLQLSAWRNISYPEAHKHDGNTGVCVIRLTDGHQTFKGLLFDPVSKLDGNTPRGTKILIEGKVKTETGFLMLSKRNTTVLGGTVDDLVDKWRVEKFGGRTANALTNAPKWIPFGKNKKMNIKIDKNFLAMKAVNKTGENEVEDDEKTAQFKAQRMAQIEALGVAAKEDDVEEIEEKVEELRISDVLNERNKVKREHNIGERRDKGKAERSWEDQVGNKRNIKNYNRGGSQAFGSSKQSREYQPNQSSSHREGPESARSYNDNQGRPPRGGRGRGRGQQRPESYQNSRSSAQHENDGYNRREENPRGEHAPQRSQRGPPRGRGGSNGGRDTADSYPRGPSRGSSRGSRAQRGGGRGGRNDKPGFIQQPTSQPFSLADFPAL